jgi:hypothetical protein
MIENIYDGFTVITCEILIDCLVELDLRMSPLKEGNNCNKNNLMHSLYHDGAHE